MTTESKYSASSRLYHGEVSDFLDAMECVDVQCRNELKFCDQYDKEFASEAKPTDTLRPSLESFRDAARKCSREYLQIVRKAELELARQWQQSDDQSLRDIGEALENQDYSGLAI